MNLHFYHCEICGKVIAVLSDTKTPTVCCGQEMKELPANQIDFAAEKHVPVFRISGNTVRVTVGSVPHPMTEKHSIKWIGLRTALGFQFRKLNCCDSPEASFCLCPGDQVEAVYAFCNLHGLWCSENKKTL